MSARRLLLLPLLSLAWSLTAPAGPAGAAELVMFREDGCPYCKEWEEDVGAVYPMTEEAAIAPLRRVDIHDPAPEIELDGAIRYTPTFVLVEDGQEIDRITGYPGEEVFWWMLGGMLERLTPTIHEEDSS
ncbi:MAG: thioredoxin family protein [Halofilum sp. (in: g-proteobacteria)]|nr:thioredoxin family protein [Halofilum sp. (in: g-proteobacteria)]